MNITKQKIFLIVSGAILALVGGYICLNPSDYLDQFGLTSGSNVNFYSDLRAMGGSLLIFGLFAIAASFKRLLITTLVYAAYGLFRLVAVALDGTPGIAILAAATIEIVIAFIGLALVAKPQQPPITA